MPEINPALRVRDLLRDHPEAKKVLAKHGMLCPACKGAENDTLSHAATNHGVRLDRLLSELKTAVHKSG
jgi:hybrid cluster-associated redox disulfide protein